MAEYETLTWYCLSQYVTVYLHEFSDGFQAQKVISPWVASYNSRCPHSDLGGATPAEAYDRGLPEESRKKTSPSLPAPLQHQDEVNKNLAA